MRSYHIGLDFGTYQTKACVFDLKNNTHEFFYFESSNSFFLLSRVGEKSDGTFEYGNVSSESCKNNYYYFKIAAAEDSEFIEETHYNKDDPSIKLSTANEFKEYAPELLSTLYLTFIIFSIKETYKIKTNKQVKTGSLLRNSLQKNKTELEFTIQLGIPTEWSQIKNLKRKKKFEKILITSQLLQLKYKKISSFLKTPIKSLISDFNDIKKSIISISENDHETRLNTLGISVYPETAAGLAFITKTKQLLPGYYTIMDIGGGSTDISFFNLNAEGRIRYLASESYLIAANNVYAYSTSGSNSVEEIHKSQERINNLIESNTWVESQEVKEALNYVLKILEKLCYKLFNKRVLSYHKGKMVSRFHEQPIILYGGGARLPIIKSGNFLIYDNGVKDASVECAYIQKQEIDTYQNLLKILPDNNSWMQDFGLLVVALGLSLVKDSNTAVWLDDRDYHMKDKNLTPDDTAVNGDKKLCKCGGRNEECVMCDGKGYIEISENKFNRKTNVNLEKKIVIKKNNTPDLPNILSINNPFESNNSELHEKSAEKFDETIKIQHNKTFVKKLDFELNSTSREVKIIVENVNYQKKVINFIGSQTKFGFFNYNTFLKEIKVGDVLSVRFKAGKTGGNHQVFSVQKIYDDEYKRRYCKNIEGKLKIPKGKLFGFVEDVYVNPNLIKTHRMHDGMYLSGMAIRSYDHTKHQWAWKFIL